ncbi:hypothetical protein KCU59_g124, partial [Aureobasidium melanogenum]
MQGGRKMYRKERQGLRSWHDGSRTKPAKVGHTISSAGKQRGRWCRISGSAVSERRKRGAAARMVSVSSRLGFPEAAGVHQNMQPCVFCKPSKQWKHDVFWLEELLDWWTTACRSAGDAKAGEEVKTRSGVKTRASQASNEASKLQGVGLTTWVKDRRGNRHKSIARGRQEPRMALRRQRQIGVMPKTAMSFLQRQATFERNRQRTRGMSTCPLGASEKEDAGRQSGNTKLSPPRCTDLPNFPK